MNLPLVCAVSLAPLALPSVRLPEAPNVAESFDLVHAPEKGSTRATSITWTTTEEGGELTCHMNGQDVPAAYLPQLEISMTDTRSVEMVETFARVGEGGPSEWLRRFDTIGRVNEGEFRMSGQGEEDMVSPWTSEGESSLEGGVVKLELDDAGELARALVGGDADADALDGIEADMAMAFLLPDGEAEIGDEWRIETPDRLLDPIGDLAIEMPAEAEQFLDKDIDSTSIDGWIDVAFAERVVIDDVAHARLTIRADIERISVGPGDLTQVPVVEGDATDTKIETFELGGECLWNLEENALASLSVEGTIFISTETVRDESQGGPDYTHTFEVGGSWKLEIESETVSEPVRVD